MDGKLMIPVESDAIADELAVRNMAKEAKLESIEDAHARRLREGMASVLDELGYAAAAAVVRLDLKSCVTINAAECLGSRDAREGAIAELQWAAENAPQAIIMVPTADDLLG